MTASLVLPPALPLSSGPGFSWAETAEQCAALIAQHGQPAVLRRASAPDRWVRAFIRRLSAREMMGGLTDPLVRSALVAAPVDPVPDHQQDRLITFVQPLGEVPVELENLRIIANPESIRPGGTVAFWKLSVRR